ncbi:MAG TPA: hypothetical protein VEF76_05345 [Patescibacteria group bacterium]|nr:hypothetical protein [Patescibacteria group bacterium]
MPVFNPNDYVRRVGAATEPAKIDTLFNEIAALPAAQSRAALIAIERAVVRDWQSTAPSPEEVEELRQVVDIVEDLKGTDKGDMIRARMDNVMDGFETHTRVLSRIFANVATLRGDEAHPLVKIYVAEEARLPADEVVTGFGQTKLMVLVEQQLQELAGRRTDSPAPVRKKGGASFDL